jgi:hypothetical protein
MGKLEDMAATEAALAEFLANGGKIQQIPTGKSGRVEGESFSMWGKKKKASPEPVVEEEVVEPFEEDHFVIDEDMVDEVAEDEEE